MKITETKVRQLVIETPGLDPVRVMLENYEPGQGRITITCWGRAWSAAWFHMGGETIEQFFQRATPSYLLGNLTANHAQRLQRNIPRDDKYILKIISAVQVALAGVA